MGKRIAKCNTAVVILSAVAVVIVFLGMMNLSGYALQKMQIQCPGFGNMMITEAVGGICGLLLLVFFGYIKILKEKGEGFLRGFYIGGFMTGYCIYSLYGQLVLQQASPETQVEPFVNIVMFLVSMFLVGFGEEVVFRGLILNLFLDKFGNEKKGILISVILSSLLFGATHSINFFAGVSLGSVLIQMLQTVLLGMVFAEIYLLSGNIWIVIIAHALTDVASLMSAGIFGAGNEIDAINKLSPINLLAIPIFLVPTLILFRRKKLEKLVRRRCGEVVVASQEEVQQTMTVTLILGILSLVLSCLGYGAVFGVVGLLGSYTAKKDGATGGMWTAGFVTSLMGTIISVVMMVGILVMMPYMNNMRGMPTL